jgi:carbamoyltransferase
MNIVGISAFFHDSAACLLRDGKLVAAASEERFSRMKHDYRLPVQAYRFCLGAGGLNPADIDCIAYYENPAAKSARQRWAAVPGTPERRTDELSVDPEQAIRDYLGFDGPVVHFDHH